MIGRERSRALIIDGVDTYKDWGLILSEQSASPPEPKTYLVDIPSGDGSIDLTEALSNDVTYSNRKETYTFLYDGSNNKRNTFEELKSEIQNRIHGRRFKYKKTFDDEYTYTGRMSVSDITNEGRIHFIKLDIEAEPYKTKGLITNWYNITDGAQLSILSGRKRIRPKFEFNQSTLLVWNGKEYNMPKGTFTMDDIVFESGANMITMVPSGISRYMTYGELEAYNYWQVAHKKRVYEWYRAEDKFMLSALHFDGIAGIEITGKVTITAKSADGQTSAVTLDLGDNVVTSRTENGIIYTDRVRIYSDGSAAKDKSFIIKYEKTGGKDVDGVDAWASKYIPIDCPLPFFNARYTATTDATPVAGKTYYYPDEDGSYNAVDINKFNGITYYERSNSGIASVSVSNNGRAIAFDYETINVNETQTHGNKTYIQVRYSDYAQGGTRATTYGDLAKRTVSSLSSYLKDVTSTTTENVIADDGAKYQVWVQHEWSDL